MAGGVGFAEGVLAAGGEALGECWEVSDAVLELTDQRARVLDDGVERHLGGGGGDVSEGDRECPSAVGRVVGGAGVEVEPGELSERQRPERLRAGWCRPAGDQLAGVGAGAGGVAVDGHLEGVAADLARAGDRVGDGVGALGVVVGLVGGVGEGVAEGLLVSLPGAVQAAEAGVVGVGAGFVEDQRVAGGEGLDFAVGEGVVADVVDLALVKLAAHDLVDEAGLASTVCHE